MTTRVLIVERPGPFRDALLHEMSQRGVEAHVRDDAMEALASIERLTPHVVVVSDNPGPPGALGLCRVLQRKLTRAQIYRIGEPSAADQLDERSTLLPRAVGASAVAAAIFDKANDNAHPIAPRAYEGTVGSLELGPLLIAVEARWLTGRLTLTRPGTEREIVFVRGQPVYARSTVLSERIGTLALRRSLLSEPQLDQAVDVARARGVRLGVALLDLNMLDAVSLMKLLAAQLLEQLTAACNSGAMHARFVIDRSVVGRFPLQRMSSMTALLHAVAVMPDADISSVLTELAPQAISAEVQAPVERFLSDLQLSEVVSLSGNSIDTVGTLREVLRVAALGHTSDRLQHPDVLALTLLRSGVFRMRQLQSPAHTDLNAGVRTLSPPSLVNAAVRCAHSDFSRWPLSAITRARTPLEQTIDVTLHGKRTPELARTLTLHGPESDCETRFRDVYSLLLRDPDLLSTDVISPAPVGEVRLRCHAQLKQVDALEMENLGGLCRAHLLQTRERIERVLALLPAPDANASLSVQAPPAPPVGYLGPSQSLSPGKSTQSLRAVAPGATTSLAPGDRVPGSRSVDRGAGSSLAPAGSSLAPGAAGTVSRGLGDLADASLAAGARAPGTSPEHAAGAASLAPGAAQPGALLGGAAAKLSLAPGGVISITPTSAEPARSLSPDGDRPTLSVDPVQAVTAPPAPAKPAMTAQQRALLDTAGPLLEQGRWRDLRVLLADDNTTGANLPAPLALLYAVALKEEQSQATHSKHDPFAGQAGAAEAIAISVVQKLFELPEPGVISVMIAKRLLRKRPLDWKQKPPTRVSAMLVGSALLLGALVGFLLHPRLLGLFWK